MNTSARIAAAVGLIAAVAVGAFLIGRSTSPEEQSTPEAPAAEIRGEGGEGRGLGSAAGLPGLRKDPPPPPVDSESTEPGDPPATDEPTAPPSEQPVIPPPISPPPTTEPPTTEPPADERFGTP